MAERVRPTERQIRELRKLDTDALIERALQALHALNRRAKEKRDRASGYRRASWRERVQEEMEAIYALKSELLTALVEAGKATVYTFDRQGRYRSPEYWCSDCDREWRGDDECYRCGGLGAVVAEGGHIMETWYVVEVGQYRWHQPSHAASTRMREVAVTIDAHDPDQPQREIPKVGLTIEAQHRCIELAIERLLLRAEWRKKTVVWSTATDPNTVPASPEQAKAMAEACGLIYLAEVSHGS